MSAQLLLLEPELREVLEPVVVAGFSLFLFSSPSPPGFPPEGAVEGLDDFEDSVRLNFLLGFFFSLANIDCLATRDILCCLGELLPGGGGGAGVTVMAPPVLVWDDLLEAGRGLLVLPAVVAVVVINRPAAVFLEVAELSLLVEAVMEVMEVFARVILGPEEETTVFGTALTLLAKVDVIFTWDLALSSDFSRLQAGGPDEAC